MEGFGAQKLVGRANDIRAVADSVRDRNRRGALVVADAGLGKSALAHAVVAELGAGVRPFYVHASPALSTIPYGALAPLLTHLSARDAGSPVAVMRAVMERLRAGEADGVVPDAPALLVVDDAHDLDEASADLIVQVVASMSARAIILTKPGQSAAAPVLVSGADGMLVRHTLHPLTQEQVHELCQQVLGGPVLESTSGTLAQASGGNPMLVLGLIFQCRRSQRLVRSNDLWLLTDGLQAPDARLQDLIKGQLAGLSPAERDVLEIVALAEPLPLSVVFELGYHDAVDALTEANLIEISEFPQRLVRPRHPLFGEVLRQLVPAGRSLRLRQRVMERLTPEDSSVDSLLRQVGWSLDCGITVPDERLLAAARLANNLFNADFAMRSASAVQTPEAMPAARVQMALAHYVRGDYLRAHELVRGVGDTLTDLDTVKAAALLNVKLQSHTADQYDSLEKEADTWLAAVDRIAAQHGDGSLDAEIASARRESQLVHVQALIMRADYAQAEARLVELVRAAEADHDAEGSVVALAMLGEIYSSTGRSESAVRLTGRALGMLTDNQHSLLAHYEFVLVRHVLGLLRSGKWQQVEAALTDYSRTSPRGLIYFGGGVDLARGLVCISQGSWAEGLVKITEAVEGLRVYDLEQLLPLALGVGSLAAAITNQAQLAEQYVADFAATARGGSPQIKLLSQGYAAATQAKLGDRDALARLHALADQAQSSQMSTTEMDLRVLALKSGDLSRIQRLLDVTRHVEGPEAVLLHSFARALIARNAQELVDAGTKARDAGYLPIAIHSLQEAQRLANPVSDRVLHQQIRRTLGQWQGVLRTSPEPVHVPSLTKRERDISLLVVAGHRNAEIAGKLSLSVRTVEGHIYRIFDKLGIKRREELTHEHLGIMN